jgi:serine/threonine-protein kinase
MADQPPSAFGPGDVLAGKYRVERVIGAGGMGVVVAAKHLQLDQTVALKFMTLRSPAADERFLREARAAARLKSEHAAKVHDVGNLDNGAPYMVMEYLEGSDLNEVLRAHGALPIEDAVGYVMQACEALGEAHALGIVHRDLKPHNLFLTIGVGGRPKIKVLDFGISKMQDGELALTRSSDIVGTPVYMSPEQLRSSKDVDARADIWALGAMLYELVTGHLPFEAENVAHLCSMVLSERPRPPRELRADIPEPLSDAIMRCLSRDPAARFPGVVELVADLEPFAPAWATIDRVRWVPSMVPSGRAVISSRSHSSGKTSAAWSDTELATTAPPSRWKSPATFAVGGTVALVALLVAVYGNGATHSPTDVLVGVRSTSGGPAAVAAAPPAASPAASTAPVAVAASPAASTAPVAIAVPIQLAPEPPASPVVAAKPVTTPARAAPARPAPSAKKAPPSPAPAASTPASSEERELNHR